MIHQSLTLIHQEAELEEEREREEEGEREGGERQTERNINFPSDYSQEAQTERLVKHTHIKNNNRPLPIHIPKMTSHIYTQPAAAIHNTQVFHQAQ